jgi:hypothetical protein
MKLNLNYSISMAEPNKTAKALNESLPPYHKPEAPDNNTEIESIINKDPASNCMNGIHALMDILNQYAENNPNPIQNEFEFENPFDFFAW